jgi:hypothetical protein
MIKAEQMPDEVVEAAARMRYERHIAQFPDVVFPTWDDVSPNIKASRKEDEQAILAVARPMIREECAKVAESTTSYDDVVQKSAGCHTTGQRIAAAIRAME